jgi:serine/threonine protein kinase
MAVDDARPETDDELSEEFAGGAPQAGDSRAEPSQDGSDPNAGTLTFSGSSDTPKPGASKHGATKSGNLHGLERFGDYQILDSLGTGSFATVYKARDETAAREVALKILRSKSTFSEDVRARFLREARALAKLDHENVVRIYHVISENDVLGLCMELVKGESLEAYLGRKQVLQPTDAARVGIQLCAALGAVHDAGFVHRDIKAENIMIDGDRVVLMDFGISRPVHDAAPLTAVGVLVGTPIAMAPEQHQFKGVDARTDIYALGSLLYRLLSGNYPIIANSMQEMRRKVIEGDYPRLLEAAPDVPLALADIITKALEIAPADRYKSTLEMENALRDFAGMPPRSGDGQPPASTATKDHAPQRKIGVDRILMIAILVALLAIIGILLKD